MRQKEGLGELYDEEGEKNENGSLGHVLHMSMVLLRVPSVLVCVCVSYLRYLKKAEVVVHFGFFLCAPLCSPAGNLLVPPPPPSSITHHLCVLFLPYPLPSF